MNMIQLDQTTSHYLLTIPQALMTRAKKIKPSQWDPSRLVWKYPRNKDTYELLINEFENDIKKIAITPPSSIQDDQAKLLAKKDKTIATLERQAKSLKSNLTLIENQRDQYLCSIVNLEAKVDYFKNESSDLEMVMKKITRQCIGDKQSLSVIIDEIDFDLMLPINLLAKIEKILKSKLKGDPQINSINELIHECKEKNLLSNDAVHLLHAIRRQRNLFAHDAIDPRTRMMRVVFVIAAFSLLSEEF